MRTLSRLFSLLLVLVLPPAAMAEDRVTLTIGALMPLSGEFAMQAAAFRDGMLLAVDQVDADATAPRVRLLIEDTGCDPKHAATAAKKLIDVNHVSAAITTCYPETAVGGAEFQRCHIPSLALWDSSPQIDAMGEYIFAIGPWTPSAAEAAAAFAVERLQARRAVVVNTVEEWSTLVADLFAAKYQTLGGVLLERLPVNPTDSDFRALIAKIKTLHPHAVYAPLAAQIVPFHKQLRDAQLQVAVISSDIITDEHIRQAPDAFEGVYQTGIKDPQTEESRRLFQAFERKYGHAPAMPWFVATGADAIRLYAYAAKHAGINGEALKDFLYTLREFPGAQQKISISSSGSSPYFESMFQIKAGKFVAVP